MSKLGGWWRIWVVLSAFGFGGALVGAVAAASEARAGSVVVMEPSWPKAQKLAENPYQDWHNQCAVSSIRAGDALPDYTTVSGEVAYRHSVYCRPKLGEVLGAALSYFGLAASFAGALAAVGLVSRWVYRGFHRSTAG